MHEYDITLKSVLMRVGGSVLAQLTGASVQHWHNVELPEVRTLRLDLLGESPTGQLIHIELQSFNDPSMIWRMAEYGFAIRRKFGRWPSQCVLYAGYQPLRMTNRIENEAMAFGCRMTDLRDFDAEPLLASSCLEDNILAVLTRLRDERESVRRILERIAGADPSPRRMAMRQLTILAGLRKLGTVIRQEARKVPILDDIADHDLLGPMIRRGREEGRQEGERLVISRQIGKRFGSIPAWARERLDSLSPQELEQVELRLLDAPSLEALLS